MTRLALSGFIALESAGVFTISERQSYKLSGDLLMYIKLYAAYISASRLVKMPPEIYNLQHTHIPEHNVCTNRAEKPSP